MTPVACPTRWNGPGISITWLACRSGARTARGRVATWSSRSTLFAEELSLLPASGRGYYRAVALVGRATAEHAAAHTAHARSTIAEAITPARDIRSPRVSGGPCG